MKNCFVWTSILGAVLVGFMFAIPITAHGGSTDRAADQVKQLLAATKADRETAREMLMAQYDENHRQLEAVLSEAVDKHKADSTYGSPLHSAIKCVAQWRVWESDTMLLGIIDYQLDISSFPVGMDVAGYDLYPAASALVSMRVDTQKVIAAIQTSKTPPQIRLLTWVLYRRAGTVDAAKSALGSAKNKGGNDGKLEQATELLEQFAKSPEDLLPSLAGPSKK